MDASSIKLSLINHFFYYQNLSKSKHKKKRSFFPQDDFTEDLDLLSNIKIPKKYQHTLEKIKMGSFTKTITNAERKLIDENFKFQLDSKS